MARIKIPFLDNLEVDPVAALAGASEISNAALLGLPDYLSSRGASLFDDRTGQEIADALKANRAKILGEGAIPAGPLQMIGQLASPVNKIAKPLQGLSYLTRVAGTGAFNAATAKVSALLSGKSLEESDKDAAIGGALAAGVEGVAGPAGKALMGLGKGIMGRAMGLGTANAQKAAQKYLDLGTRGQGAQRLEAVAENVRNSPAMSWFNLLAHPTNESFNERATEAVRAHADDVGTRVRGIVDNASNILGPGVQPNRRIISDAIQGADALGGEVIGPKVDAFEQAFNRKYSTPAPLGSFSKTSLPTLTDQQAEKQAISWATDPEMRNASQIWRRSLRSNIENQTDALAPQLGIKAGDVAELNRQYGADEVAAAILGKAMPTARAQELTDTLTQLGHTTGGGNVFQASSIGHMTGSPALGLALAAPGVISKVGSVGRPIGKALFQLGSGINNFIPRAEFALGQSQANPGQPATEVPAEAIQNANSDQGMSFDELSALANDKSGASSDTGMSFDELNELSKKKVTNDIAPMSYELQHPDIVNALRPHVVKQESAGKADAVSPKGAGGLWQIMPATWSEWAPKLGFDPDPKNRFDPVGNDAVGAAYMDYLVNRYNKNVPLALAAYNWGLGHVDTLKKALPNPTQEELSPMLPPETQQYLAKILPGYLGDTETAIV